MIHPEDFLVESEATLWRKLDKTEYTTEDGYFT